MTIPKCSFDNEIPVYVLTVAGMFDIGTTITPHDCGDDTCMISTRLDRGLTCVFATPTLVDPEGPMGAVSGTMVLHVTNDGKDYYEVLASDYDGYEKYGELGREAAQMLVASGALN